jgi:hypothetical protein
MTYSGVVLLLTGWQADEDRVVKQYHEILESYVRFLRDPYALTYALTYASLASNASIPMDRCGFSIG